MSTVRPVLQDGIVAIVKRECETCLLTAPVLDEIRAVSALSVFSQDDTEPFGDAQLDEDLTISWHYDIETVPTLLRVVDGVEVARTVGWSRENWTELTGLDPLGTDLPDTRPGCGSMSVDPDQVDALRAFHSDDTLRARRIELAASEDEVELMYARGWSDGLPVVAPTPERVLRMLTGTTRDPQDVVAVIPPDLVEATVEKVAIAAVMAGCLPEYLPWVLAAVEAACTDEFNMHGVLATTMPVGPVIVCSGPGTKRIGMNAGGNALGQGNRANSTIGRALQLLIRNFGGGRPGGVDRAMQGSPAKVGLCFAEHTDSPIGHLATQRGLPEGTDAVTVFAGEGPRGMLDQLSRTPDSLIGSLAAQLRPLQHHKLVLAFDAILVLGPEHVNVFVEAGWGRDQILAALRERLMIPVAELERGAGGIAEGMPDGFEGSLPKFGSDGLLIAYAGGGAGLFSSIIAGWANGPRGSQPVSRAVRP